MMDFLELPGACLFLLLRYQVICVAAPLCEGERNGSERLQPTAVRPNGPLREGTCALGQLVDGGWEQSEGTPIVLAVTAG